MIPSIEEILRQVLLGTMSLTEAMAYIERHAQLDVDNAIAQYEEEYDEAAADEDRIRNSFINSLLQTAPAGADSENVAMFAWDTAQRLMDKRARNVPMFPAKEVQEPPETLEQKVARLEADAEQHRLEKVNQKLSNSTAYDPDQHKGPWTAKEVVDDSKVPEVRAWGDGRKYAAQQTDDFPKPEQPRADGKYDDGPF